MSFSRLVKEELTVLNKDKKEQFYELGAFLTLSTTHILTENENYLWFKAGNVNIARRFVTLIKSLYETEVVLLTGKEHNFEIKNKMFVRVNNDIDNILENQKNLTKQIFDNNEYVFSYLRGSFLAAGSVNDPKKPEYHVEIFSQKAEDVIFIQKLMNHFDLNAKVTKRRTGFICYLKNSEKIADFLRMIGCIDTYFTYEDQRIKRDFLNSITRVMNCELANENKAAKASMDLLEAIEVIEKNQKVTNEKLQRAIQIRKEFSEESLNALVDLYNKKYNEKITKSGLNHRFLKLKELAKTFGEQR